MWKLKSLVLIVLSLLYGVCGQVPLISPVLITGLVGESVTFICDSQLPGEGISLGLLIYDPMSDRFVFFTNSDCRLQRVDDGSVATFTFGPLTASDDGTIFRCQSSNGMSSANVTVSVLFPPNVTRLQPLGDPVTLREGFLVVIQIKVIGNPQPTYTWTRNGVALSSGNGVTVTHDSLTFNSVTRVHSGQYVYEAINTLGMSSLTFSLDVQYPPEFPALAYTPDTLNCTQSGIRTTCASYPGIDVTFRCSADGNPTPDVDVVTPLPMQLNVDASTNDIVITSVTSDNAGNYSCTARSLPGFNTNRCFKLFVGGVADPVSRISVAILYGMNRANVSWLYDNRRNSVPATNFTGTVRPDGVMMNEPVYTTTTSKTYFVIPGYTLEINQTYLVTVVVNNLQGVSEAVYEDFVYNSALGMSSISYMISLLLTVITVIFDSGASAPVDRQ